MNIIYIPFLSTQTTSWFLGFMLTIWSQTTLPLQTSAWATGVAACQCGFSTFGFLYSSNNHLEEKCQLKDPFQPRKVLDLDTRQVESQLQHHSWQHSRDQFLTHRDRLWPQWSGLVLKSFHVHDEGINAWFPHISCCCVFSCYPHISILLLHHLKKKTWKRSVRHHRSKMGPQSVSLLPQPQ